jgi:REP element-mobilizing transposase RayT
MATRTNHSNQPALYYITFTCRKWLPLFQLCNAYDIVYQWFDYLCHTHGIKTTAYTIMPNHVHVILFFPTNAYQLNTIIGNGKRFMAYALVKRLKEQTLTSIFLQLKEGLTTTAIKKGQQHQVFEASFDAKPIYHRQFLIQKINYIHLNCVRGKWKLASHWQDYEHSSAMFYEKNQVQHFSPVHYDEWS